MTTNAQPGPAAAHTLWTIARIQHALSPLMARRFLLDITHAPAHQVMNVFTAWQGIAATNEATQACDPPRSE